MVLEVNLDPAIGSEPDKVRPCFESGSLNLIAFHGHTRRKEG
jgi:hypothetical protein